MFGSEDGKKNKTMNISGACQAGEFEWFVLQKFLMVRTRCHLSWKWVPDHCGPTCEKDLCPKVLTNVYGDCGCLEMVTE